MYDSNRFRNGLLGAVERRTAEISQILNEAGQKEVAEKLEVISGEVLYKVKGINPETRQKDMPSYNDLGETEKGKEEKKKVANEVAEQALKVLEILAAGPQNQEPSSVE